MILLCGIPSEPSLRMVREELDRLDVPHAMLNQRSIARVRIEVAIVGGEVRGTLAIGDETYALEAFQGVLIRMMDDRFLPEVRTEPEGSELRVHCRRVHETVNRWCEITNARVLNRPSAMTSNGSKPYQAQLIRANGLAVPETLITTDAELVREFRRRHGRVIYKSISGVRSIVRLLEEEDMDRLEDIRWCPVQFQEFIEGVDLRVHVIGGEVFATLIESGSTDYRYAIRLDGESPEFAPVELEPDLAARCVSLSHSLGLAFAGIDLRITPAGTPVCFEVNPSPAFSYYEANAGQPIAAAVARYLASGS